MQLQSIQRPTLSTQPRTTRLALRVLIGASLLVSGAALANTCQPVSGTISPLVTCGDPSIPCYQGTFTGVLTGTFQSFLTSADPHGTGTLAFTAQSLITTSSGTISTADAGIATGCQPNGVCARSHEVMVITSGTGDYTNASGRIILSGPYLAGQPGEYRGVICVRKPKGN